MSFKIEISRKVLKFLEKTNKDDVKRILEGIQKLKEPFSIPYEKLKGRSDIYRIRIGDYRVIYYVDKDNRVVLVLKVDLRERVYKRF